MNPNGVVVNRRVKEDRPLNPATVESVVQRYNILSAWKQVRANKGAPGIDGITIEEFSAYAHENWSGIKQSLLEGDYKPSPVKRVEIPKDSGGTRLLGIPTVMDRVIRQAICQVLSPVFDPHFSESSFGFRSNRSAHQAAKKVLKDIQRGYAYAVDIDLEKFFDTVDHQILINRVARKVRDKGILRLIEKCLRAGVVVNGRLNQTAMGVPQDGPLSPLLSNILLDDLDKELEKRGHQFGRYADDLIILVKSNDAVECDHWLRRRIRMCYWKQWRRAKKRIGELIKLGAPKYHAILTGLSRKGYWHLAKTLSANCGLGNEFLQRQGLTSIRTLWIQIHYPAKAR